MVDENGEPKVMTHNAKVSGINIFRKGVGDMMYFADEVAQRYVSGFARGQNNYQVFLDIKSPARDTDPSALKDNNDGLYVEESVDGETGRFAATLEPNQIKSASG